MTTIKKIWNIVSTALVIIMVLAAVIMMGTRVIGFQCYTVISGSMEPTYSVGDLLYVKPVDPGTIEVGDPITFILNEQLVVATHRVVRVDSENQHFYTKGDANEIEDSAPVHFNNVIGVPKLSVPQLGYVSNFIQNPPGTYITIAVGVALILAVFLPDLLKKKPEEEETEEAAEIKKEIDAANEENELLKAELEKLRAEMSAEKSDNGDE